MKVEQLRMGDVSITTTRREFIDIGDMCVDLHSIDAVGRIVEVESRTWTLSLVINGLECFADISVVETGKIPKIFREDLIKRLKK